MSKKSNNSTLFGHLDELRKRLIISTAAVAAATIAGFTMVELLQHLLTKPAGNLELIFVSPPEAMMATIRLAITAGVILAMPVILYQLLAFIVPGLYKNEKKILIPAVLAMIFFFVLGVSFAYTIVMPFTLKFFMNFASNTVSPMFTISNYLSFATSFLFSFGIVFQLPIVFLILGRLHIVDATFLRKNRKYAIFAIVIVAAVLTPPDIVSQIMLSLPLLGLYELGIFFVVLSNRMEKKPLGSDLN